MPRMTKREALKLLQAAYDALDTFDSRALHNLPSDMLSARHYLRELKMGYFQDPQTGGVRTRRRTAGEGRTGLEQPLPGTECLGE